MSDTTSGDTTSGYITASAYDDRIKAQGEAINALVEQARVERESRLVRAARIDRACKRLFRSALLFSILAVSGAVVILLDSFGVIELPLIGQISWYILTWGALAIQWTQLTAREILEALR